MKKTRKLVPAILGLLLVYGSVMAPLAAGEVRARAILSGISHGTEMKLYRGASPFGEKEFDADLRLFRPATG